MIITETPFRMSFFGGGTDYPDFYREYGGSVISTTFDKYCTVSVSHLPPFFDYTCLITYSKVERAKTVDDVEHPAVRNAMKYLDMRDIRLDYQADLPARSGLGTSSSFAVGMLLAFYALKGRYVDKRQLALDAIHVERVMCQESGGVQDQIAAAFGGLNRIDFSADGFTVNPLVVSNKRKRLLNSNLMLFFTGFSRFSGAIASSQEKAIHNKIADLREMLKLVDEAQRILTTDCDLGDFGRLLHEHWKLKHGLTSDISTGTIDELYARAMKAGALGGKLLGAGGGGFLLFYVEPEKQPAVRKALSELMLVPFEFEDRGTRIMYYRSEEYVKEEDK